MTIHAFSWGVEPNSTRVFAGMGAPAASIEGGGQSDSLQAVATVPPAGKIAGEGCPPPRRCFQEGVVDPESTPNVFADGVGEIPRVLPLTSPVPGWAWPDPLFSKDQWRVPCLRTRTNRAGG